MGSFIGSLIFLALCIWMIVHQTKRMRKIKAAWKHLGCKLKDLIDSGKYTYGHPEIDAPFENCYIRVLNGNIEIYNIPKSLAPILKGTIPVGNIQNITIEDASTIQKRITAARLLMTGVFAFAIKKKKKDELAYLVIEWMDSMWHKQIAQMATFEFSEKGAMERCNKARNELIRLTR